MRPACNLCTIGERTPRRRRREEDQQNRCHGPESTRRSRSRRVSRKSPPPRGANFSMVFAIEDIDANGRSECPDDKTRRRDDEPIHERFSREVEVGNVEYKLKQSRRRRRASSSGATQYRLAEGGGQAIYEIGVEDDGNLKGLDADEMRASLATLSRMCASLDATMRVLHRRRAPAPDGERLEVAEVLVQALADPAKAEVRVACIGASQSGKSTLLGVLSTGALDDGHGSARMTVLRHMHEIESGATSCISQQVLGFDGGGRLLNSSEPLAPTGAEIVEQAARTSRCSTSAARSASSRRRSRAHRPHARLRAARRRRRRRRLLRHPPSPRRRRRPPPPRRRRRHQARPLRGRRPRKGHRRRRGARPRPRAAAAAAAPHGRRGDGGRAARPCVGGGRARAARRRRPRRRRRRRRPASGGRRALGVGEHPSSWYLRGRAPASRADALPVAAARARLGGVARAAAASRRRRLPPRERRGARSQGGRPWAMNATPTQEMASPPPTDGVVISGTVLRGAVRTEEKSGGAGDVAARLLDARRGSRSRRPRPRWRRRRRPPPPPPPCRRRRRCCGSARPARRVGAGVARVDQV